MALNIKNPEVERLVEEQARLTGTSKTETIRLALVARREWLARRGAPQRGGVRFLRYLEEEVWPQAPPEVLGQPLSRQEREEILGYGPEGA
jgi:antitoxin VapB